MKKTLLNTILLLISLSASAQLMRTEELEAYAKECYGDKWTVAAKNLGQKIQLDKNNSLTYTQVIDCVEKTKQQLYIC